MSYVYFHCTPQNVQHCTGSEWLMCRTFISIAHHKLYSTVQALRVPGDFKAPIFQDNRNMKVTRMSALGSGCLYPTGNTPGTHFLLRLSRPQGQFTAGRIVSMKNSSDNIGNRTRDLPTCLNQLHHCVPFIKQLL